MNRSQADWLIVHVKHLFALVFGLLLLSSTAIASKPHRLPGSTTERDRHAALGSPAWSGGGRIPETTAPIYFDAARTTPLAVQHGSIVYLKAVDQRTTFCFTLTTTITIAAPTAAPTNTSWGDVTQGATTRRRSCVTLEAGQDRFLTIFLEDVEAAFSTYSPRICASPVNANFRIGYGLSIEGTAVAEAIRPYCSSDNDCAEANATSTCPSTILTLTERKRVAAFRLSARPIAAGDVIVEVYR